MKQLFFLLVISFLFVGCKSELTKEKAMEEIMACEEFQNPFYAPFHTGSEVLSGENYQKSDKYINEHLGSLIAAGLITAKIKESNSWRSVLEISLTEKGAELEDKARGNKQNKYVKACNVSIVSVDSIRVVKVDEVLEVDFTFKEYDVTPFGEHLGLTEGREHKDVRSFIRDGYGWKIE